jgi:hypothetical protein
MIKIQVAGYVFDTFSTKRCLAGVALDFCDFRTLAFCFWRLKLGKSFIEFLNFFLFERVEDISFEI